ncbi:hypothetical protein [Chondromyces apiculatus]|uniref:SprT-like domain-containing protein n=1 Tax=Chondromyces apiculatus DSM 436 TaxID=1192034 RepID=A0A017SVG2_9BACT|nr:hypothetical protein [Chondromyces apiculatus]EYF00973.1 Hypothetical protein CAP_8841 [Chondromyces apiculatus DSM 436]
MAFPFAHPPFIAGGPRGHKTRSTQAPPAGRVSRGTGKGSPLAPRVSPAAIRVPDPRALPFEVRFPPGYPRIFVHEGARQAMARRLELATRCPVLLSVTDNFREMLSSSRDGGVLRARVHHMFLDAPASVQEALVRYLVDQDREASLLVGQYIDQNGYRIRASRKVSTPLRTQGQTHDLLALYRKVNHTYFGGAMDALITWGRRGKAKQKRRTIKLGSYSAVERLIRIHPALDRPWVPRYFLSYIIYHEMLHHVIPSGEEQGRRLIHPPEFLARERMFRHFDRAITWEKTHVSRLLRAS